ncbi:MAG: hypothetical protein PHS02_02600 [Candidatus ainarchaeum sp.]|nr:hypothetical protein [Candidatus ainarchaeum sp.]
MKYVRQLREHFRNAPAFTINDVKVFLRSKGISSGYVHLLLHNLAAKGEIGKISRGTYTFSDDAQTVGFAFRPFYYGLQEALSIRNLWEQETNPVVITPRSVRSGVRTFQGGNFLVKRISRRMFFGFELLKYGNFWIPVSDVEKTLIDFAYFRQPLSRETAQEMGKKLRMKVLRAYLRRCPVWVGKKVLESIE